MPYKYKYNAEDVKKEDIIKAKLKQKIQKQEYYRKNKERILLRTKMYRLKNLEKYRVYMKNFDIKRKLQAKKYNIPIRTHRTLKPEFRKPYKLNYKNNNTQRQRDLKLQNQWRKNNRNGCSWHIGETLRARIRCAFTRSLVDKKYKYKKSNDLLGCSINYLRTHLKKQFKPGMNWENYGFKGWHIDHIKPVSSFNLKCPVQQMACFHYSNLQPLWACENLSKGAKW